MVGNGRLSTLGMSARKNVFQMKNITGFFSSDFAGVLFRLDHQCQNRSQQRADCVRQQVGRRGRAVRQPGLNDFNRQADRCAGENNEQQIGRQLIRHDKPAVEKKTKTERHKTQNVHGNVGNNPACRRTNLSRAGSEFLVNRPKKFRDDDVVTVGGKIFGALSAAFIKQIERRQAGRVRELPGLTLCPKCAVPGDFLRI